MIIMDYEIGMKITKQIRSNIGKVLLIHAGTVANKKFIFPPNA